MKSINWAALAIAAALPALAAAVPVKNPDCSKNVKIQDVKGLSARYFNADCTVLYVAPPRVEQMRIGGYQPDSGIAEMCAQKDSLDREALKNQQIIEASTDRVKNITDQIITIERNLKEGLLPVGQTRESLEARMDQLLEKGSKLRESIAKWQKLNTDSRLSFAQGYGGKARFMIESGYEKFLSDFQRANPNITVQPMPIDQNFLSFNEVLPEASKAARMPAVNELSIPSLGSMPLLLDPMILLDHKELAPQAAPSGGKIFNGGLEGLISFSPIGACAVQKATGGATKFSAKEIKNHIAVNSTYSFQLQVTRKYDLWYDFKKLVQIIHEQSTHGGLFSTKTLDSLTDNRSADEWIHIDFASEDSRFETPEETKKQIRREFLDRALAQIIALQTDSPTPLLGLIAPGKNGASEAADQLQKCPHAYCQIGAAGLKVLSSIFGSTSATSSLVKSVSGHTEEHMHETHMVPAYGTVLFE